MSGRRANDERRGARVRVGRLIVAIIAMTVTAISVNGGISHAPADGKIRVVAVEPPASTAAEADSPVPSSALEPLERKEQPRNPTTDAVRDTPSHEVPEELQVPERASGRFDVAEGATDRTGTGPLVTYAVEVERGLPLRRRGVTQAIDDVLASPKGWTATKAAALQRVSTHPDIRIRLASPRTTDQLCSPLDTGGRLSCRDGDLVVLNAWRWVNGADTYAGDLRAYRQYMVNHEVGHALGNAHASCTEPGQPASVMMQQTKGLDGCLPNPWPTAMP